MKYQLTFRQYKEALLKGKLLGLQCKRCQKYTFPPKMVCAECGGEDLRTVQLSNEGEVKTFTVIRIPPEGFNAPYIVAIVELKEGPWTMCNIEGVDPEQASMELIGKKGTLGFKEIRGDKFSGGDTVALTFMLRG